MRSTLVLPDELIAEAQRLSGLRTKREVVHTALEEFVRRMRIERLRARLGKTDLRLTQSELQRLREDD